MPIEKQYWIAMLKEGFIPSTSFLSRSVDMSEFVDYNKINLAEAGVDPKVLVDNTNFPIASAQRTDTPLELPLHTFDTENTIVRNIEEKESAYKKMESVVRAHRNALHRQTASFAANNWAPSKSADLTPVRATTGAPNASGQKALSFEDILQLRSWFTGRDVPVDSLVLVLNAIHEADLLAEDAKRYKEMIVNGKIWGITYFTSSVLPYYTAATGVKKAYGAAVAEATDTQASLMYCDTEVMRALGTTEVFAKYKDPEQRGDILGYQQRFTALPIRGKYTAALYSEKAAASGGGTDSGSEEETGK